MTVTEQISFLNNTIQNMASDFILNKAKLCNRKDPF